MTIGKPDRNKPERERKDSMKLYNVYVYNTRNGMIEILEVKENNHDSLHPQDKQL